MHYPLSIILQNIQIIVTLTTFINMDVDVERTMTISNDDCKRKTKMKLNKKNQHSTFNIRTSLNQKFYFSGAIKWRFKLDK